MRYHYDDLARDLAYRWLYCVTSNACDYNGTIAEKYDLVNRTAQVFAEYGNIGTKFSYMAREGFGWTNASVVVARSLLSPQQLADLNRNVPPEWHALRGPMK
jgi:alpha,alpha-trehalase